jgi:predicted  nucleic acid-binding Zn-ribbon protein
VADVDGAVLQRLLDLQSEDSALRLLEHRKETLPESRRLAGVGEQLAELDSDIDIAQSRLYEAAREQTRLEGEVEMIDQKLGREEKRLFAGGVANPRELSSLQAEVAMLKQRRSAREDELLEVMVGKEGLEETLGKLRAERAGVADEAETLQARERELVAEIDVELGRHGARAAEIRAGLPGELLALYDQVRTAKGGVGAAALVDGTCQGCHTKLPARTVEQMRAQGGLQRCESCRRILVVG